MAFSLERDPGNVDMLVMKFGGTSVGSAEKFKVAAEIIRRFLTDKPLIVVSAIGGTTDMLERAAREAERGLNRLNPFLSIVRSILRDLEIPPYDFFAIFENLRASLEKISHSRTLTNAAQDEIVSYGELISSRILACYLNRIGINSQAWDSGDAGFITDERHLSARPIASSSQRIRDWYYEADSLVPIVTGFIGKAENGVRTTVGRGGSDFSAAWYAVSLHASELQIWTDVSGIMTADPRLVKTARRIETLSFDEASEMAFRGAKVLHPDTLRPVRESGIKVRVLNSHDPESQGTTITDSPEQQAVKCCTSQQDLLLWSFWDELSIPRDSQISRVFNILSSYSLNIVLLTNSEAGFAVATYYNSRYSKALLEISKHFRADVKTRRALVSLVGEGVGRMGNLISEAFAILHSIGAEVDLVTSSSTGRSFSIVIDGRNLPHVVNALHDKIIP